ncbi:MAG TPA: ABC transporter ATP-binding protein [Rhizobiaceae bacterium]|nr:ABC transporter ATP-binding protein [Rhizobiaceae bacterium]
MTAKPERAPLLSIRGLGISFPSIYGRVEAVRGLDLDVGEGEIVGLVGESGSGKSLTSLAVMGLVAQPGRVEAGEIRLAGRDIVGLSPKELREMRGRDVSMVFQEPLTALNPAFPIGRQLTDVILTHRPVSRAEAREIAVQALTDVGIREPRERLGAYPHEFSGGMRQRVLIATAIACEPKLLIADEPTTALDVTVQAQIIDLLRRLQAERGLSILLISHNLHLVSELCERVVVMYGGQVMESGSAEELFLRPRHPYSRLLQDCVPSLDNPRNSRLAAIPGAAPSPGEISAGCPFAPRCARATDRCTQEMPPLAQAGAHKVACWHPLSEAVAC